jgi:predicted DNA-binding transcriptional regulator AlpA
MAHDRMVRCYGCSLPVPSFAVDENGLCDFCVLEEELEINGDLDDDEEETSSVKKNKLNHCGETRDGCPGCRTLDRALFEIYGAQLCMSGKGHLTAADLLRDLGQLDGACAAVRRDAIVQLTATAAAIAAHQRDDPETAPARVPEDDRLLSIDEAVIKTGLSKDQLYRRKDLPFRVKVGPAQVRFSQTGIEKWIKAKTVRSAA